MIKRFKKTDKQLTEEAIKAFSMQMFDILAHLLNNEMLDDEISMHVRDLQDAISRKYIELINRRGIHD